MAVERETIIERPVERETVVAYDEPRRSAFLDYNRLGCMRLHR